MQGRFASAGAAARGFGRASRARRQDRAVYQPREAADSGGFDVTRRPGAGAVPCTPGSDDWTTMPAPTLRAGRHFLQIPGPTNVPDRVLRAIDRPTIDHRGPEFGRLGRDVLDRIRLVFKTRSPVVIYPSSGTGAWEAALVNTLSPGDRVLMCETGHFAMLWKRLAERIGLVPELLPGDWRHGADPGAVHARLAADSAHAIKAVCVVHNETSTGVASRIAEIRRAIDRASHPALFLVDTISSLASIDYRHDEWGVDVTVAGSQKGLMLPPGLSFNAVSDRARAASRSAKLPKSYWAWDDILEPNATGYWPHTPATNLLYGLQAALDQLLEEGLDNVFARHDRHAEATRRAVRAWGLEVLCADPAEYSSSLTAVMMPAGHDADAFRRVVLDAFDMSLGAGLSKLAGRVFRIGHLGDFNDLMLAGTLSGVEMGLALAGVPHRAGGVAAALDYIAKAHARAPSDTLAVSA
jgi:alanine-glyoxylate transaminase/serine-glyoxylate transaminase/serine-pyruvate transaminase